MDEAFYRKQREQMSAVLAEQDPGDHHRRRPRQGAPPILITANMVGAMAAGSVIVDMAAGARRKIARLTRPGRSRGPSRRDYSGSHQSAVARARSTPARCFPVTSARVSQTPGRIPAAASGRRRPKSSRETLVTHGRRGGACAGLRSAGPCDGESLVK